MMTKPPTVGAPVGLRVSEKLLATYRQLQDRYADPHLDRHGIDRVAEKLASRILRACELYPWTPREIFDWTWAWLHILAYGEEAKTRKCQGFYAPIRSVAWALEYPDRDMIVAELDDADRDRALP